MRIWISIWTGSTAICRYIGTWLAGGVALRLGLVLLVVGFIKGLPVTTHIVIAAAAGWLVTAIILGLQEPDPTKPKEPEKAPETPGEKEPADPAAALTRQQLADLLRGLLQPKGHLHLTAIADALPGPRKPTREVRALLERHTIPVRPGVRAPGAGVREGVHRDDIPAPAPPTAEPSSDGVVAPGQSNNNNTEEGLEVHRGEGMTIIRDPADRARSHALPRPS